MFQIVVLVHLLTMHACSYTIHTIYSSYLLSSVVALEDSYHLVSIATVA